MVIKTEGEGARGIYWVESRDAAKPPKGAQDGLTTKDCLAPNPDGAKVENDVNLLILILWSKFCSICYFFPFLSM